MLLRESSDLEVKKAQGRDGNGAVPDSAWETYSAMANTEGGTIVLGADEDDEKNIIPLGVRDPEAVLTTFWDTINNTNKVSVNLLHNRDAYILRDQGLNLVVINVPRARRGQRPVYVGQNPMRGTFRRNFAGDYRCDNETVSRMIAEGNNDTRDGYIVEGYTLEDIDPESLAAYRNAFRSTSPGHPWIQLGDQEFLQKLGGWKRDRSTGLEGLTLAGLLMFGKYRSIFDAVPFYSVDYQERPTDTTNVRWMDRVTADGTWSGNLYDFFRRVYPKLTAGLKVPFRLEGASKRIDETSVHEALREALVNSLVHADYHASTGILVVKQSHRFFFRNPGGLRLPLEEVLAGGISDCRNRELQKMFRMAGAGDQAGSGMPKILGAWREQDWRKPVLRQSLEPEHTSLELTMQSLFPGSALRELEARFGVEFSTLGSDERLALVTALAEEKVTNQRLQEMTDTHRTDLTKMLKGLVQRNFLIQRGSGPLTSYHLNAAGSGPIQDLLPFVNAELPSSELPRSRKSKARKSQSRKLVEDKIISFALTPKSSAEIAEHLEMSRDYVSTRYLKGLVREGILEFTGERNSPGVRYKTTSRGKQILDEEP